MWGYSHCDKISFNGAVASSSLMLSLVISIMVLSISSAREDDAAGETKKLARFIQSFKVIIALAYILLVVGIIALFPQLEGYVKVHHDHFYGQVYTVALFAMGGGSMFVGESRERDLTICIR